MIRVELSFEKVEPNLKHLHTSESHMFAFLHAGQASNQSCILCNYMAVSSFCYPHWNLRLAGFKYD